MTVVIKAENIGKKYILNHQGQRSSYSTLRDSLTNLLKPRGNSVAKEPFWALKEINFEINQGDKVGIIGKNGAGKSTLLKILSRITEPTTGKIGLKGRVASLLEVGTGFHPELTGRENIFLNGSILGMTHSEIKRKFEEIVDFAGVEKFLDTPVKRYSSGMYVRLAFSVAAHLESEILIVDEVLAVGDAEFQKKCLGKMEDVSKGQGKSILFVSHNMGAVRQFCDKSFLLSQGQLIFNGTVNESIEKYLNLNSNDLSGQISWDLESAPGEKELKLTGIRLLNHKEEINDTFDVSQSLIIEKDFQVFERLQGVRTVLKLSNDQGIVAFASSKAFDVLEPGGYTVRCIIPENLLNRGKYYVTVHFGIPGVKMLVKPKEWLYFLTETSGGHGSIFPENWPGLVAPKLEWEIKK